MWNAKCYLNIGHKSPLNIQLLILGIHLVTGSEFNAQIAFQITFPEVSSNVLKVDLQSVCTCTLSGKNSVQNAELMSKKDEIHFLIGPREKDFLDDC